MSGLRDEKKRLTQVALQDAALELFEQNGFAATSVEEIADRARVSPRSFFRYFDHKQDPVFAGNEAGCERLVSAFAAACAESNGAAPIDLLRAALPQFAEAVDDPITA